MIHFKGLCLSADENKGEYRALPKQSVRAVFRDANGQEVATLSLTSNEFGSFSGVFTAPADRLTGTMTISTENPQGSATVRVEEYKRPKFQVKIDIPDREFRLNDEVGVPGEAMSYTGAPIDGALVRFRVVREVRYPSWWYFPSRSESQEIAHGTMRTDEAGKFTIVFPARPDPKAVPASQPVFSYSVQADVTDGTGETRSATGFVRVGYTAIEADLRGADWQDTGKPVVLSVTATTLNGKPAAAKGTVEVYALKGPDRPVPRDLFGSSEASRAADWRQWPEGPVRGEKRICRGRFR